LKTTILIAFLIQLTTVFSQDRDYVNLNYSVEYNQENKFVVSKITYNLKKYIDNQNKDLWAKDSFFPNPGGDLISCSNLNSTKFEPTILSVTEIGNQMYIVKVGFFVYKDEFYYLNCIYNFIAIVENEEIMFANIREHNMIDFEKYEIEGISFYYEKESNFDNDEALKFSRINKNMAQFFNEEKIDFKYVKCKNINQCKKLVGYDFDMNMFDNNQNGAFTYPYYKLIFSGNNSFINTHELLHLYVKKKFGKTNMILDEGLATYFGGSKGYTLDYHLNKLKKHIEKNDIDIYKLLFYDNYVLDSNTSLLYTMGGLICKIVLEKCSKEELFFLLDSAKSNEELIEELEVLFDIDKSEFNIFFKKHLLEF
jgi:hypothetical protein